MTEHTQADQERWWPARAQQDVRERMNGRRRHVDAGRRILTFDRFLTDGPGAPTRVIWR